MFVIRPHVLSRFLKIYHSYNSRGLELGSRCQRLLRGLYERKALRHRVFVSYLHPHVDTHIPSVYALLPSTLTSEPPAKMLAGRAPMAIGVMWAMTTLAFIFVPLRLYTRIFIVRSPGLDDYVFSLGWVFLMLYTSFVTVAGIYGFGQSITVLSTDDAVKAVYMEMIGQTFAVLGMAIAKLSVGIFLLRIVIQKWQKASIWASMVSLMAVSVLVAAIFWVQKLPSKSIYDPRVHGRNVVSVTPFAVLLGAWCAFVDFYFAILPWTFVWKLNMKTQEKLTISISLSLGFLAGICGIIRTIELGGLSSADYTANTVNLIVWSAVELAVTLICVGIPNLRPLYRKVFHGSSFGNSREAYERHGQKTPAPSRIRMQNIHGVGKSYKTHITRANQSDEEILGPDFQDPNTQYMDRIRVQEEVRVEMH